MGERKIKLLYVGVFYNEKLENRDRLRLKQSRVQIKLVMLTCSINVFLAT